MVVGAPASLRSLLGHPAFSHQRSGIGSRVSAIDSRLSARDMSLASNYSRLTTRLLSGEHRMVTTHDSRQRLTPYGSSTEDSWAQHAQHTARDSRLVTTIHD